MTIPSLDVISASARAQLEDERARLDTLLARPAPAAALGEGFGGLGRLLLAYGLDDSAEPALLNAADLLPNDHRWPYYLGYLYARASRLDRAARQFERALDLRPEDVPARIRLAEVRILQGRTGDARAILEEALRIDPRAAAAHFLLGQIAEAPSEAVAHYEAVLRLQPEATVVHNALALEYRKLGELERSRAHLARRGDVHIAVRDPLIERLQRVRAGVEAAILRGTRLLSERRYREAVETLERAVAEDSTQPIAHLNLGIAYAELDRVPDAIRSFERVLRLDPSSSKAHYNLGLLYQRSGDTERSREHLQAAVDADPRNLGAHFALSKLLYRGRRCGDAVPHFQQFLALRPAHAETRIRLAVCQVQLGRHAEARSVLEAGYEARPSDPALADALIRVLAASPDASVRDGARALELARRRAANSPNPRTLEALAMAHAELGRFPEAIALQREALRAAEADGPTPLHDHLRDNLRRYERGKPSRTPWPPTVFDR